MMSRFALITSTARRHRWVASMLAEAGELVAVIAEEKRAGSMPRHEPVMDAWFNERDAAEVEWFGHAPESFQSLCERVVVTEWGGCNGPEPLSRLEAAAPDVVFLFGSSIVKAPILSRFEGRVINMHLGLSPYYRGSGTNFWPLYDGLPECVGVTIHHATLKVDAGRILAQARPDVAPEDSPHAMGCKTIMAGTALLQRVLREGLWHKEGVLQQENGKLCRNADFTAEAVEVVQKRIAEGMIGAYVASQAQRNERYPIVNL